MRSKKYSLDDRLAYHYKVATAESKKRGKYGALSEKERYSLGFIQGAERGRPSSFALEKPAYKKGIIAGEKAKKKASSIKY